MYAAVIVKGLQTLGVAILLLGAVSCSGDAEETGVATLDSSEAPGGGGSEDAAGAGETDSVEAYLAKQQAFVDCARENGAPDMHDPNEFGQLLGSDLVAIEGDVAKTVVAACGSLNEANVPPPELVQRMQELNASQMTPEQKQAEVDYAKCMQENGVPEYPDPEPNGMPATPEWDLPGATLPRPPRLNAANEVCVSIHADGPDQN